MKRWTVEELARMIDHTYVKVDATRKQMEKLCKEAREYHFAMAAINSSQTALCAEYLRDSDIHVGAAIGFPLGQTTIAAKVFEAEDAIQNGADEIDYMINLTEVKAGNWEYVKEEMQQIVTVCRNNGKLCKVILETCYLTKDEIKQMCKIAVDVKPDEYGMHVHSKKWFPVERCVLGQVQGYPLSGSCRRRPSSTAVISQYRKNISIPVVP